MERHDEIIRIVRQAQAASQEKIRELLGRKGIRVTQPTLSRDLRSLGLVKSASGWALPADITESPANRHEAGLKRLEITLREFVVSVKPGGAMVVLRTPPADAQPVARAIDEAGLEGVLGTIGGDDTVFVATSSTRAASTLARRFSSIVAPRPRRPRA